jgi:hypothetical protein
MSNPEITGRCLCERVAYAIKGHLGIFQYCHCSRCRKFTGSAFAANLLVAPADFRWIAGEEFVGRYELEEAKHFATSFCTHCGSSLPWLESKRSGGRRPGRDAGRPSGSRPVPEYLLELPRGLVRRAERPARV